MAESSSSAVQQPGQNEKEKPRPPGLLSELLKGKPKKKKKKKVDWSSSSGSSSRSASTSSSGNTYISYPRRGHGGPPPPNISTDIPTYAESNRESWLRRKFNEKPTVIKVKRHHRGRRRRRKPSASASRSSSSESSRTASDHTESDRSEIGFFETLEKRKYASKSLKKIWGAIEEIRKKLDELGSQDDSSSNDESDSNDERGSNDNETDSKDEEKEGVRKGEEKKGEDHPTPESSEKKEDHSALERSEKKVEQESSDAGEDKVKSKELLGTAADSPEKPPEKDHSDDNGKKIKGEDPVEFDSSSAEESSGPKHTARRRAFELKTQFFYGANQDEHQKFFDPAIRPFMRVLWGDRQAEPPASMSKNPEATGKLTPGSVDVLAICFDSPALIDSLQRYNKKGSNSEPMPPPPEMNQNITFYAPFRWLIQNSDYFEAALKDAEQLDQTKTTKPEDDLHAQLKLCLSFMDEYLADTIKRYQEARAGMLKTIAFEDLWMLYKPDDIIFTPLRRPSPPPPIRDPRASPLPPQGFGRRTPQAYRVVSVIGGRRYVASPVHPPQGRKVGFYSPLRIMCYYVDFDGTNFNSVADTFIFPAFDTDAVITDLKVFPLAYASSGDHKGEEEMRSFLRTRGEKFIRVSEVSHKLYEGTAHPFDHRGVEEINTPVIIDFALAYQNSSASKPTWGLPNVDYFRSPNAYRQAEIYEIVLGNFTGRWAPIEWFYNFQLTRVSIERDKIVKFVNDYPAVTATPGRAISELIDKLIAQIQASEHILLLPGEVQAFALRNRKWVSLDIDVVQDVQYEDGWNDLVLPKGHKDMVRAVVENHASGSRSTSGIAKGNVQVDIVRGKGKGCIILLHGEPGVGKTSTAECVAAFTKRPLFPITCGDIGYEPDEVEKNLDKHFSLAHKWGCVMLLDEADVFLTKRSREDIKRNGLVSVFLRVLEYYPGILFLTTNRVGSFDDAFRSRIHLTLYYPKLGRRQTIKIFEMNLRRVTELNKKREQAGQKAIDVQPKKITRFARKNWETLSWNGRQIRNAFQTAIALAEFDARDDPEKQATISKKQFKTIAKASMDFDDYLFHTHGGTDESANARKEQTRYDYEIKGRPGKKPHLSDSSSDASSESASSSSGSSTETSDASDEDSSSDGSSKRRKKRGKHKEEGRKSKKKSDDKSKKSKSKKDKHS